MKFGGVRKRLKGASEANEMVYIDAIHPSEEAIKLIENSQNAYDNARYPSRVHARGGVSQLCYYATILFLVVTLSGQHAQASNYRKNNAVFAKEPTESAMRFFGGDMRYLSEDRNIFSLGRTELYKHMDNYGSGPITVSWSTELNASQVQQIQYVFDYLNDIFSVINPSMSFELRGPGKSANVKIAFKSGMQEYEIMETHSFTDITSASRITRANVYINKDYDLSEANMRLCLLHEAMHFLIGCEDFPEETFEQVSLMNYNDLSFVSAVVQCQDVKLAREVEGYVPFTSFMPVDLASLIAVYGDMSNKENVDRYTKLISDTVDLCENYLGEQDWLKDSQIARLVDA